MNYTPRGECFVKACLLYGVPHDVASLGKGASVL